MTAKRPRFPATIEHPLFPILPSCPVTCLTRFGLPPVTASLAKKAVGDAATTGDLLDYILSVDDFFTFPGIGPKGATELRQAFIAGWRAGIVR